MDQTLKDLTDELAVTYAKVAMAEAARNGNGEEEVVRELRQKLADLYLQLTCSSALGWCTVNGTVTQMSECQCLGTPGCSRGKRPTGSDSPQMWQSAQSVFAELSQILADTYAKSMGPKKANETVVRRLGELIREADSHSCPTLGTCTIELSHPPTVFETTKEQCEMIPGAQWKPY